MAKFQIGVMTDSFKLPFEQGLAKAAEVGAQGIQLYVVDGEMKYDTFDDAKVAKSLTFWQFKEHGNQVYGSFTEFTSSVTNR